MLKELEFIRKVKLRFNGTRYDGCKGTNSELDKLLSASGFFMRT